MKRLLIATAWLLLLICSGNAATLTWTATGDDSLIGTADRYDIRWSLDSTELVTSFATCNQIDNEPLPEPAGTIQTLTITGLPTNVPVFFGMMTADEASNWSGLSNIARVLIVMGYVQGDCDCSGLVTITDAVAIINYLFAGMPFPNCNQAGTN